MEVSDKPAGADAGVIARKLPSRLWLRALILLIFLSLLIAFVVYEARSDPWSLVFTAGLMAVGALMVRFPALHRAVMAGFAAYFLFALWVLITVGPAALAFGAGRAIASQKSIWLQATAFVVWLCLLAALISLLATESRRTRLFDRLRALGPFAPVAYAANVLLLAVPFFGTLTRVLMDKQLVVLQGSVERTVDFYMWHFLDAIPLLSVNKTMHWDTPPMTYDQARVGLLVLVFKAAVIIPVIGTFRGYWKYTQQKPSQARLQHD